MDNVIFDIIWEQNILGLLKSLEEKLSTEKKEAYGYEILTSKKSAIKKSYDFYNQFLKDHYHISNGEQRLDQHKVAACLCSALIDNKLVRFNVKDHMPEELVIINYKLAFAVSASIVYEFLVDFYKDLCDGKSDVHKKYKDDFRYNKPKAKLQKLIERGELFYPITNNGHKEYPICMIRSMALNDLYGQRFDLISYANTMFLLEQYNIDYIDRLTDLKTDNNA